ncbi:hypothetical protein HFP70_35230 [Streptomyces sp. ARC14]|uniref:hypothetical protein n=1 Tax=Streptomyces sp. ARC14 TaxID=2724152 RepID=UPI00385730B3
MSGNERAEGPNEVGSGGTSPAEFVARLRRGEHPVQMYTVMKPVPNPVPVPDDADEWVAAFGRVVTGGRP